MTTNAVLDAVAGERGKQRAAEAGGNLRVDCSNPYIMNEYKLPVLVEEVGEAASEVHEGDDTRLYNELIQVAAVAVAWAESLR